jgi:hypothetical protein
VSKVPGTYLPVIATRHYAVRHRGADNLQTENRELVAHVRQVSPEDRHRLRPKVPYLELTVVTAAYKFVPGEGVEGGCSYLSLAEAVELRPRP